MRVWISHIFFGLHFSRAYDDRECLWVLRETTIAPKNVNATEKKNLKQNFCQTEQLNISLSREEKKKRWKRCIDTDNKTHAERETHWQGIHWIRSKWIWKFGAKECDIYNKKKKEKNRHNCSTISRRSARTVSWKEKTVNVARRQPMKSVTLSSPVHRVVAGSATKWKWAKHRVQRQKYTHTESEWNLTKRWFRCKHVSQLQIERRRAKMMNLEFDRNGSDSWIRETDQIESTRIIEKPSEIVATVFTIKYNPSKLH